MKVKTQRKKTNGREKRLEKTKRIKKVGENKRGLEMILISPMIRCL